MKYTIIALVIMLVGCGTTEYIPGELTEADILAICSRPEPLEDVNWSYDGESLRCVGEDSRVDHELASGCQWACVRNPDYHSGMDPREACQICGVDAHKTTGHVNAGCNKDVGYMKGICY